MKHLTGFILACMLGITQASAVPALLDDDSDIPDAMQHMMKAPPIDFASLRDPFASYLARTASRGQTVSVENRMRLSNRKREKLENYDLDTLDLVAIFSMGGERVGMVQDSASKGFIVRRGSYLGKNNGKIEKITADTIFLVEQVLNPAGDIIDRQVTLTMNEVNE